MIDFDPIAAEYARHRRVDLQVVRGLADGLRPECDVLDVGCGTGNYSRALRDALGCRCVGIDPSFEMLAAARRSAAAMPLVRSRAERLPLREASFDRVFSVDVVHHLEDQLAYFQEVRRVLRSGGRICTATESEPMIRKRLHSCYFPETIEIELARYPPIAALRELMLQAGFGNIAEETVESASLLTDIGGYRQRAFSCLRLISPAAFDKGIARLEAELSAGPIEAIARHLLLWGTK